MAKRVVIAGIEFVYLKDMMSHAHRSVRKMTVKHISK